jgi:hypothetical protein
MHQLPLHTDEQTAAAAAALLQAHRVSCELADALLACHVPHAEAAAPQYQLGAICSATQRNAMHSAGCVSNNI